MSLPRTPAIKVRLSAALLVAVIISVGRAGWPLPAAASSLNGPHAQGVAEPLVLAFYYAWYDEGTWSYDRLSDLPAQPYASRDREAMGRHIEQAKAAGIDGFLVAWYGPADGNQTETNLTAMLEEAAARNFRIGVLFETDSPFFSGAGDVTAALQHLNAVHAAHPAYLRSGGRPVIFFWRPALYNLETWWSIRSQADPSHQNVWISEGTDAGYLQVFDGHHLYSNTWNPPADLAAVNGRYAGLVTTASTSTGTPKLWVATVMPGYDDTRIRASGFARDRAGGGYFAQAWQAAIASQPAWIVINSFNEWPEGSYIEPSVAHGDQFIGLSATWSAAFKGSHTPVVQAASFEAAPQPPAPRPLVNTPTAFVNVALLNLRAGPGTEYGVLGRAEEGTPLPITGTSAAYPEWWQVTYDAPATGPGPAWVYAPLVDAAGPLEQVTSLYASAIPPLPPGETTLAGPEVAGLLPDPSGRPLTPYLSP